LHSEPARKRSKGGLSGNPGFSGMDARYVHAGMTIKDVSVIIFKYLRNTKKT